MKEEKFQVINFIRKLIICIDKELSNFPKKDIELKNRIRNLSYDILELCYQANTVSDIENKQILLEKIIAKIKVLDFLLNLCYDKMIINIKNNNAYGVRAIASINCGYAIIDCIRDNIETNYVL